MKYLFIVVLLLVGFSLNSCGRDGATGPAGANGLDGFNGEKGDKGDTGPQGPAGSNGTEITVVEFCPGSAPVYPSVFPEVGLCIDNKLYAVYSTHGGFLTLIPPGAYNSNTVGSNCNFTVLPNCRIQ